MLYALINLNKNWWNIEARLDIFAAQKTQII